MRDLNAEREAEFARLTLELAEAREQQAAAAEVLRIISSSPANAQPVFQAIVDSAARLCAAAYCFVFRFDGELLHFVAHNGIDPEAVAAVSLQFPLPPSRMTGAGRAILDRNIAQVADMRSDPDYEVSALTEVLQLRSVLAVPMLREGVPIGVITVDRREAGHFPDRQVELLRTFADQAVIAVENVRLFEEVTGTLEQQTVTADTLKLISQSAFDLKSVLHTLVEAAARLCGADKVSITRQRDGRFFRAEAYGFSDEFLEHVKDIPVEPGRGTADGRALAERKVVQIDDVLADAEYQFLTAQKLGDFRTVLSVPMLREGIPAGVMALTRTEVRPFTDKQIGLVKTLADQAAIAIENARLFEEVQARSTELSEALRQQTATADVLQVISRSAFDLDTVLTTLVSSAIELCEATRGVIWLLRDGQLYLAAHVNYPDEWVRFAADMRITPAVDAVTTSGLAAFTGDVVNVEDVPSDPRFRSLAGHQLGDYRGGLAVPLKRNGEVIGTISLSRPEARLFTDRQIALVQTFADQAVIAIENSRLFDEVQVRNRDVTEALEQQTATSDILRVIASSPTDIQPVLDAVAETAARLCDAFDATIYLRRDDRLAIGAHHGPIPVDQSGLPVVRDIVTGRAVLNGTPVHVHDLTLAGDEFATGRMMARELGFRAILATPLLREGQAIGALMIRRTDARPFTEKQIELLKTFADQAVIAIENVRLFEEVQASNREVTEALQQQTATAEVLRVISTSPTDMQPVFDVIAESAARLCDARFSFVDLFDGKLLHFVAHHGLTPEMLEVIHQTFPVELDGGSAVSRAIESSRVVQIPDVDADPQYKVGAITKVMQVKSTLSVPMLAEGVPIGAITINRVEPGYYPENQVKLLTTFADQAVIAIKNVRLFEEVQARNFEVTEALEQQTATSDILRVIAASPTDIQPVLKVVAESAARFCDTHDAVIMLTQDDMLVIKAHYGPIPLDLAPQPISRDWVTGRAFIDHKTIQVLDLLNSSEYPRGGALARRTGHRTIVATPLMRNEEAIGALVIRRTEVRPFSDKQIELLKTFADQAVIAISNVRLFEEVEARTAELSEALQQQTATADVLKVISRSTFDVQLVLQTLLDSAIRLCGAEMGSITLREGDTLRFKAGSATPQMLAYEQAHPHPIGRGTFQGRAAIEKRTIHVPDISQDKEYERPEAAALGNFRAVLSVPLKRDGEVIGVFGMAKSKVGPFAQRQIELVETFADQAVIALENSRLFEEVRARTADLSEALQQQTATADVLKVIGRSTVDLDSVLQTLVEAAARLCDADKGTITRQIGGTFYRAHAYGFPAEFITQVKSVPVKPDPSSVSGRALLEGKVVHIADIDADPEYTFPVQQWGAVRTVLGVPILREGVPIGVMGLTRSIVRPFTSKQIELVSTFADQAAIAIENARLFEEVQARTADLTEALQQQTATADVLKVISRSAFDLRGVLQTLIESAAGLCSSEMGGIFMQDGDVYRLAAAVGMTPESRAFEDAHPNRIGRESWVGRTALQKEILHVPDVFADQEYGYPEATRLGGFAAVLGVPLMREGAVIGVFVLTRVQVGSFAPRQIELVRTFADQAVIAIENVRLFEEVQARTADLSEALQQQTATADVLKVISRSAFDLDTVLSTLIASASRLCDADRAQVWRRNGDVYRLAVAHLFDAKYVELEQLQEIRPGRDSTVARALQEMKVVQIVDVLEDPEYGLKHEARIGGIRTVLAAPLLRNGEPIGVFSFARDRVEPFAQRQIELVQTFADQAVIAIENVRLFEEVQARTGELEEALQQQTATADVLKVISRSAFDLDTVLQTLVESAARLCDTGPGLIFRRDGDVYRFASGKSLDPEFERLERELVVQPGRGTIVGRALLEKRAVQVLDALADPEYEHRDVAEAGKLRSVLAVPLLRQGEPIGVFGLSRDRVEPFTERQVTLVQTFADQAVIAIENARLFDALRHRTEELSRSLEELRTAKDRLVQTEKLASLGQLTAGIAHEIKNPLNFVNNFSHLSGELVDELREALDKASLDGNVRDEVDELTGLLKGNLDKVVQHGRRADSIVKNMLMHSREGSGEHRPTGINAVVEESLNLAYHGARAEKRDFNITLERSFDPDAGEVDLYPQEITRVLLNLISNGFYATRKRAAAADSPGYDPVLSASTKDLGDQVEIRIRDNGTGIPPEVVEKMFNPFFTTKPAGEGTGLGLSLSHDIVVKQHAGTISVDTRPGEFTEFRIVLPRMAASLGKEGGVA